MPQEVDYLALPAFRLAKPEDCSLLGRGTA